MGAPCIAIPFIPKPTRNTHSSDMAEMLYYVGRKKADLELITLPSPFKPSSFLPAFMATFGDIPSVWPKFLTSCARGTRHTSSYCMVAQNVYMFNSYLFQVDFFWLFFLHFLGRILYSSLIKAEFCRYHLALNFSTKIAFQQKFFEVLGGFLALFSLSFQVFVLTENFGSFQNLTFLHNI